MARAQNLLEETLAECTDDQALRAAAERDLSHVFFQMGKLRSALAHGLASVALAEELGDRDLLVAALCSAAVADFNLGHGIRPEFMPRAMVIAGDRYIDPVEKHPGFHQPLFIQGVLLRWTDNLEKAREMLERYLRFATERHHEAIQIPALFQLGELECWAGNLSRTFSYAEELARAAEFSGLRMANLLGLILEGWVAAYQGRLKAAQTMAEEALDITQSGETRHRMRCLHVLGFASLSAGNLMDARAHLSRIRELRAAEELREPGVIRADGDEIEALIELGELQQARRLAEELEERGEALNRAWALAVSARSRALLAAATGDLQTALEHANRALQHHGALAQPFELARTLLAMGSIERRARQKRPARESLHEALDIFERVGAPLWANRVRKELDRVGGRAPTTHALTPTERQVADLVARGRTNREVAAQLFMSVKTVEANLSRTYQKLGVRSRTELAAQIGAARLPDSGGRSG